VSKVAKATQKSLIGDLKPAPGVKKVDPILVADGVSKRYGGLQAIDVAHVEIPRNAIVALIGPNGAGKTTLFNILTGFETADSGDWSFDGKPLRGKASHLLPKMGMVRTFQLTKVLGLLTVMENMKLASLKQTGEKLLASFFPFLWNGQDRSLELEATDILKRFKLYEKRADFAAGLSGGQRKLLEMARALMTHPQLIMLDEPMAGVNPALTESLLDHIIDLKKEGMTVLFVEHDVAMVRKISDWVIVMAEGKIVAEGLPDQVLKESAVIDAYLGSHQDSDLGLATGRITLPSAAKAKSTRSEK
jgi:branched-chain amino acid transport system ATP-binding protein